MWKSNCKARVEAENWVTPTIEWNTRFQIPATIKQQSIIENNKRPHKRRISKIRLYCAACMQSVAINIEMRYLCPIFNDYLNQAQSNVSLRHAVSNSVSG